MFHPKVALLLGLLALLGGESHSLPTELETVIKNDFGDGELALSMIVNQMALLKILNESSAICSLGEKELKEMRDLNLKMEVTAGQLKDELKDKNEATVNELQNMKTAILAEINVKKEEAQQVLKEVKETAASVSREVAIMTTTQPLQCEAGWNEYHWSCYKVFTTKVTHAKAIANCRSHGAYLASIGSEGENSFVAGLIEGYTYIGLHDKGEEDEFTWQDGSPFYYSKWDVGQPNSKGGNEDCVAIYEESIWHDYPCDYALHYVCEKRLQ